MAFESIARTILRGIETRSALDEQRRRRELEEEARRQNAALFETQLEANRLGNTLLGLQIEGLLRDLSTPSAPERTVTILDPVTGEPREVSESVGYHYIQKPQEQERLVDLGTFAVGLLEPFREAWQGVMVRPQEADELLGALRELVAEGEPTIDAPTKWGGTVTMPVSRLPASAIGLPEQPEPERVWTADMLRAHPVAAVQDLAPLAEASETGTLPDSYVQDVISGAKTAADIAATIALADQRRTEVRQTLEALSGSYQTPEYVRGLFSLAGEDIDVAPFIEREGPNAGRVNIDRLNESLRRIAETRQTQIANRAAERELEGVIGVSVNGRIVQLNRDEAIRLGYLDTNKKTYRLDVPNDYAAATGTPGIIEFQDPIELMRAAAQISEWQERNKPEQYIDVRELQAYEGVTDEQIEEWRERYGAQISTSNPLRPLVRDYKIPASTYTMLEATLLSAGKERRAEAADRRAQERADREAQGPQLVTYGQLLQMAGIPAEMASVADESLAFPVNSLSDLTLAIERIRRTFDDVAGEEIDALDILRAAISAYQGSYHPLDPARPTLDQFLLGEFSNMMELARMVAAGEEIPAELYDALYSDADDAETVAEPTPRQSWFARFINWLLGRDGSTGMPTSQPALSSPKPTTQTAETVLDYDRFPMYGNLEAAIEDAISMFDDVQQAMIGLSSLEPGEVEVIEAFYGVPYEQLFAGVMERGRE